MTYRIVSLPINPISKIPQSGYYTKKSQVAAFLPCLSARQLDMMELLNALALAEGRGVRALSSRCSLVPGSSLPSPSAPLPAQLHCLKSLSTFPASPRAAWRGRKCCGILISSVNHRHTEHPALSPLPQPLGVQLGRQKGLPGTCPLSLGCFHASICPQLGAVGVEHPCSVRRGGWILKSSGSAW